MTHGGTFLSRPPHRWRRRLIDCRRKRGAPRGLSVRSVRRISRGASVADSPQQHFNDRCSNDCLTEGRSMTSRILHIRRLATLVLASTGAVAGSVCWAADDAPVPSLPEVIVTAQKRAENIQDVPISVIALSSQELKDAGVTDIKNLTVLTPGVTVTSTTSENSTTARIRGIGTVGDNPGLESSVGIVIDGVYRPRNGVGFGDLGELEQVEVLEGPQGVQFGKNNDAGVINITTKRPTQSFEVSGEITGGNFSDREASASVSGPLAEGVSARVFVEYQRRDGWLALDTGQGPLMQNSTDDRNVWVARAQ